MTNSADPDQLASLKKPTDLDLLCLQRKGMSGFSRTKVNSILDLTVDEHSCGIMQSACALAPA